MGKGILALIFIAFFIGFVVIKYILIGGAEAYKAVFEEGENSLPRALSRPRVEAMNRQAGPNARALLPEEIYSNTARPSPNLLIQSIPSDVEAEIENVVRFSLQCKGFKLPEQLKEAMVDAATSVCVQLASYGYFFPIKEGLIMVRKLAVEKNIVKESIFREAGL